MRQDDTPPLGTESVASAWQEPGEEPDADQGPEVEPEPADSGTPASRPGSTDGGVHEKLIELDDLRRRGIVTEEEFQAKKAELISRL